MINELILVGRIKKIEKQEVTLEIPRNYKNEEGIYESDEVTAKIPKRIWEQVYEYCKIDDTIGIKGKLETGNIVLAAKVTFLKNGGK